MSSTEDRHVFLPSLEAAEVALTQLPTEWQSDTDVQHLCNKLACALRVLRGLN